ncbi:unnamed protein product [Caretta caretta]
MTSQGGEIIACGWGLIGIHTVSGLQSFWIAHPHGATEERRAEDLPQACRQRKKMGRPASGPLGGAADKVKANWQSYVWKVCPSSQHCINVSRL